ncbi:DUF1853 family protein [Pararobbsia silviterrae]|uniref:DUF1853 family protein n=1 Tax=Pararobbsia silviterrae TaxID=1792498 RepID=A0A494XY15_9BURK|nr:DUF1853 family protein [Pararobbsia silviterrae]RKP54634.1 DUF1853 family protein [Pararobbsia silviterrae]
MDRSLPRASDLSQRARLSHASALADALTRLRDPCVRDLAWLLFAPRVLCATAFGSLLAPPVDEPATLVHALHALDIDPSPLHASLAPLTTRRVGHYAERLVHYALTHLSAYTLIAANLPLRVQKQTVGECDFLLEDPAGLRLHWELAVKCYLRVDVEDLADPLAALVGPALGDRLDIKLARLLEHQLPLTAREDYAALLPRGPWHAQMWVSGWLFDRFDHWRAHRAMDIDPRLARDVPTGFWTSVARWPELADAIGAHAWTRLPRLRWIAPLAEPDSTWCDAATLTQRIADAFPEHEPDAIAPTDTGRAGPADTVQHIDATPAAVRSRPRDDPFAIAAWKRDPDGRWRECARGFIVADDWENRARAFAASAGVSS